MKELDTEGDCAQRVVKGVCMCVWRERESRERERERIRVHHRPKGQGKNRCCREGTGNPFILKPMMKDLVGCF